MAKTKISEFSATAADNTDITNINIAEGCSPANVNNAIRSLMALLKNQQDGSSGDPFTVAGTLVSSGTVDITGAFRLDGTAGASGQALVSAGGANTPTWSTLGTMSSQNSTAVAITGGTITNAVVTTLGETTTVSATAATGTINYDVITQGVLYYTSNASANWTVNFRGNGSTTLNTLMAVGETRTVTFLVTQGATAYYNNAVTVDGSSVTPKWQGGTAPTAGNTSGIDVYTYSIIKTASATFTVLASQTQFK